jgi:hypothetical protein
MVCLVGYGLSGGLFVGCGAGCMGLHSVGCSGWYIDAVVYLSGLCSGFESCIGLWVCSVGVDGVCSGTASQYENGDSKFKKRNFQLISLCQK